MRHVVSGQPNAKETDFAWIATVAWNMREEHIIHTLLLRIMNIQKTQTPLYDLHIPYPFGFHLRPDPSNKKPLSKGDRSVDPGARFGEGAESEVAGNGARGGG